MASDFFIKEAQDEALDARLWLKDRQPKTVEGFRQRLTRARAELRRFPETGPPYLFGTRRLQLAPYPYSLVYRIEGDMVVVLAVPHASQAEGYWHDR
jgi:plasmid stabilization system protein ParE